MWWMSPNLKWTISSKTIELEPRWNIQILMFSKLSLSPWLVKLHHHPAPRPIHHLCAPRTYHHSAVGSHCECKPVGLLLPGWGEMLLFWIHNTVTTFNSLSWAKEDVFSVRIYSLDEWGKGEDRTEWKEEKPGIRKRGREEEEQQR